MKLKSIDFLCYFLKWLFICRYLFCLVLLYSQGILCMIRFIYLCLTNCWASSTTSVPLRKCPCEELISCNICFIVRRVAHWERALYVKQSLLCHHKLSMSDMRGSTEVSTLYKRDFISLLINWVNPIFSTGCIPSICENCYKPRATLTSFSHIFVLTTALKLKIGQKLKASCSVRTYIAGASLSSCSQP